VAKFDWKVGMRVGEKGYPGYGTIKDVYTHCEPGGHIQDDVYVTWDDKRSQGAFSAPDETLYCVREAVLAPVQEASAPQPSAPSGVDPKAAYGATKPLLALVPAAGITLAALAAEDGSKKYGAYNYRLGHKVQVMTYANAAKRHLDAFIDGEDFTSDTGVPNLGGVIMCCCIIADTMANGFADDNRPAKGKASEIQDAGKQWKQAVAGGMDPIEAAKKYLAPAMGLKYEDQD
jgi:hypothetical protein